MEIRCTQCGAAVEVAPDVRLLACPYCETALVVDGSQVLFREAMRPTVDSAEAPAHLRRFLAGTKTVAGLDREARIGQPEMVWFPFWAFTVAGGSGEQVELMPAAPSSLQGLQGLALPAGATRKMTPELERFGRIVEPEIPVETARTWLGERHGGEVPVRRTVLYHLPLHLFTYSWKGAEYRAAVDAVTGRVFPANYPAKDETPYRLVLALALMVFGLEGLVVGSVLAKLVLYAISVPPILGVAWLVSRKV